MIKSFLIHLSTNMWEDSAPESLQNVDPESLRDTYPEHYMRMPIYEHMRLWSDTLKCEDDTWRRVTKHFADCGGNMLIIDVGDGVRYHSHPEIAVSKAWSPRKLKDELARCRDLGLEPIPKLNFSCCHDGWMHDYAHMVSSAPYYRVCRELIDECCELFGGPRFFHLGMDEETYNDQASEGYIYKQVRADSLWWDDLNFYFDAVRRNGARPMMWSDKLWHCGEEAYTANVQKDVVQCNWYYREIFDYSVFNEANPIPKRLKNYDQYLATYDQLDRLGYDQLPTGSNWAYKSNYAGTVKYCTKAISKEHLLGFMTAPWMSTDSLSEEFLIEACDLVKAAHA